MEEMIAKRNRIVKHLNELWTARLVRKSQGLPVHGLESQANKCKLALREWDAKNPCVAELLRNLNRKSR